MNQLSVLRCICPRKFTQCFSGTQLKLILLLIIFIIADSNTFSQVGISSTSITPDASSILELRSTSTGFLPPRMTTTQRDAIVSPATGLLIYNTTTNQLNYYTGSAWQLVSSGGTSGTVTSVSVSTANGISGTVANSTTTPAISLSLGAITPSSVAATGTAGTGFVELQTQSSNPAVGAANSIRLFSNSLGGFSWVKATDGFSRS
ncbi:MAG: hypothetical protein M3004_09955, partial [Bacteroidota bacterium]|nr:hypothetical protein [Bacteroidota bacterium]